MREYAEIGIGREARRTFDLEQLSIVPHRRLYLRHPLRFPPHRCARYP